MEFHRYPQVILTFFNRYKFGLSRDFTLASTCSWIGHPVSGLQHVTIRPIQTRFPFGSGALHLNLATYHNSLARSTKSTWSLALPLLVSTGFQVLFHSPPGVLFTFPSRYYFAIGHRLVFRLGGWAPPASRQIPRAWRYSGAVRLEAVFRLRDLYPLWCVFPNLFDYTSLSRYDSPQPPTVNCRFGLFPVRSPLLRKSIFFFLLLRVLRCFSSPRSLRPGYVFTWR